MLLVTVSASISKISSLANCRETCLLLSQIQIQQLDKKTRHTATHLLCCELWEKRDQYVSK